MSQSINQFLESLGGKLDSQGSFSLNLDQALHKLETYSLPEAGLYVVELLALAVASKATYFHIRSDAGVCVATFDGEALSLKNLQNPLSGLLTNSESGRDTHFALALVGAKQFAPEGVEYRGPHGILSLKEGHWHLDPGDPTAAHSQFKVDRPFRFLSERIVQKPGLADLMKICQLAPLQLLVDGERLYPQVSAPVYTASLAGYLVLQGSKCDATLPPYHKGGFSKTVRLVEQSFTALLYFCEPAKAALHGLTLLRNGVSYGLGADDLPPCLCGLVVSADLGRDLSATGITKDYRYRHLLNILNQEAETYLRDLIESDMRLREPTLHLSPAIERMLTPEESAPWRAEVEKLKAIPPDPLDGETIRLALQAGDLARAESEALTRWTQLEKLLGLSIYDVERLFQLAGRQSWLGEVTFPHKRLDLAKALNKICGSLQNLPEPNFLIDPVSEHLLHRRHGRREEALQHLVGTDKDLEVDRYRMETLMGLKRYEEAQELGWKALKAQDEHSLPRMYSQSKEANILELLSHIFELEGQTARFLSVSAPLMDLSYCGHTNFLRADYRAKKLRGQIPFAEWVKFRVQASGRGAWLYLTWRLLKIPPELQQASKTDTGVSLESLLRQFFLDSGCIYQALFDYIVCQSCQQLRLSGKANLADRVLATCHLMRRAFQLREKLLTGGQ